nr:hypothetical protein [Moraxella sp. CTOTU46711]
MIITHLERATQLYQALQDYQQSTHAFSQPLQRQLTAFANHLVASEMQAQYLTALAKRTLITPTYWSTQRANPNSAFFDPVKAILYWQNIDIAESIWLAFLLIHIGDSPQLQLQGKSEWQYLRLLYGNFSGADEPSKPLLSWATMTANPQVVIEWVRECQSHDISFKFGKHRKYESIKQLPQVVDSYGHWLTDIGGIANLTNGGIQQDLSAEQRFAHWYKTLNIYRFGRLAKFEFLSLLGYLKILAIKADHCYLTKATGPKRGAKLLFGHYTTDTQLERLAVQTAEAIGVDYAVFEAALCHWQASPNHAPSPNDLP